MRTIGALIVIILCGLPALFAGWPGTEPGIFDERRWGVPVSVLAMSALMAVFILLAGLCSAAARDGAFTRPEEH